MFGGVQIGGHPGDLDRCLIKHRHENIAHPARKLERVLVLGFAGPWSGGDGHPVHTGQGCPTRFDTSPSGAPSLRACPLAFCHDTAAG